MRNRTCIVDISSASGLPSPWTVRSAANRVRWLAMMVVFCFPLYIPVSNAMAQTASQQSDLGIPAPPQPGFGALTIMQLSPNGMIRNAEAARRIGEVLLESLYGHDELIRQAPLTVTEEGDRWKIDGSREFDDGAQIPNDKSGMLTGKFSTTIWKFDGRVIDIGLDMRFPFPYPDVIYQEDIDGRSK